MDIDKELIENLNSYCDAELQRKSVETLSKLGLKDIKYIVLPNGKESWDNASEVIYNIIYYFRSINKDKKIGKQEKESLFSIMEWTKDLNWPGSITIITAINLLHPSLIAELIEESLKQAMKDKDETWIDFLKILFNIMGNIKELYFSDSKYYQILLKDN